MRLKNEWELETCFMSGNPILPELDPTCGFGRVGLAIFFFVVCQVDSNCFDFGWVPFRSGLLLFFFRVFFTLLFKMKNEIHNIDEPIHVFFFNMKNETDIRNIITYYFP